MTGTIGKFCTRAAAAGASVLFAAAPAPAVCVDPTGADGCETTVQAGVDATAAGGLVEIRAGVYFEAIVVDATKTGLVIAGAGAKKARIKGLPVVADEPLFDIDADNVTVRDLTLENADRTGMDIDAAGVVVRDVRILAADGDCIEIDGANATVEDSELVACDDAGIDVDGAGAAIRGVDVERVAGTCLVGDGLDGGVIEDNKLVHCGDYGMDVGGDDLRIEGNLVRGSPGEECLSASGSDRLSVIGNTFEMCEGVVSISGDTPVVEKNKVEGSFNGGLRITCADLCADARVVDNKVAAIDGKGFDLHASEAGGMLVHGNSVEGAVSDGFELTGLGMVVVKNKVSESGAAAGAGFDVQGSGHTLENNKVSDYDGPGFEIAGDSHTLVKNSAKNNLADGFSFTATAVGIVATDNKASGNGGPGFEVLAGATATTLSGNKASKNRVDVCDEGTGTVDDGSNKFGTVGDCGVD